MRTFVVRIWEGVSSEAKTDARELRGVLEEVSTGEATRFTRSEELLHTLRRAVRASRDGAGTNARTVDEEERDA